MKNKSGALDVKNSHSVLNSTDFFFQRLRTDQDNFVN